MIFEVSMKADTNRQWPDNPRAVGKRALSCCERTRNHGSLTVELDKEGGYSGHAERCTMNHACCGFQVDVCS